MLIKNWIFFLLFILTSCSQFKLPLTETTVKPTTLLTEQTIQQKSQTIRYQCKDNKFISLVHVTQSNKSKKQNQRPINLTYKNTTQRLVPIVTETGQKYTNIHWRWTELENYATLTTTVGVLLAEQCIKQ